MTHTLTLDIIYIGVEYASKKGGSPKFSLFFLSDNFLAFYSKEYLFLTQNSL